MLLNELVDSFVTKYKMQCLLRSIPQIVLTQNFLALILAEAASDIQKLFGAIELTMPVDLIVGTDKYDLSQSVIDIKNVSSGVNGFILIRKSSDWIEKQSAITSGLDNISTPLHYSMLYPAAIPQLLLYPAPTVADTLTVNYTPNFNLFSPSVVTTQDFGLFDGKAFSLNTVFPTQYDKLLLLGMMKQIFKDFEGDYQKEEALLKVLQFNGEKFDYHYDGIN